MKSFSFVTKVQIVYGSNGYKIASVIDNNSDDDDHDDDDGSDEISTYI